MSSTEPRPTKMPHPDTLEVIHDPARPRSPAAGGLDGTGSVAGLRAAQRGAEATVPRRRWRGRRGKRSPSAPSWTLFLFPLPALALYTAFFAIPTIQGFEYAATDWDGFSAEFSWVGLDNIVRALTADDLFRNALVNNAKFMLVVVIAQTALALFLGILLSRNSRAGNGVRALFFLPAILSSVSVAFVWKFIYDPSFGLANSALSAVGLEGAQSAFLGNDAQAIYYLAIAQVWAHTGQVMVIFVAGLQQIPRELYEASAIDGAGRWQQFKAVTWPGIAPATAVVVAYTTIQSFKSFDLVLGLGGNPPKPSLDILSTRIYGGFANSEFGYAAAQSIIFMVVIALVTWLQRRTLRLTQASE